MQKRTNHPKRLLEILIFCLLAESSAHAEELRAKLKTSLGEIEIRLFAELAPKTVTNFVELARAGFYDGKIFHRVMPGFSVQTGDPTGKGGGGPGYCFADEFGAGLQHDKPGVVSMVNTAPGSNGSQFLITLVPAKMLDQRSPVFGEVTSGLEVVQRVAVGTILERVEIVGELTLTPPEKTPELTLLELREKANPVVGKVLEGLGQAMQLGSLKGFEVAAARSRCAESQLAVTAEFEKAANARLLLYGKSDGKTYKVEQLQWAR